MAVINLTENFNSFFKRINPSISFTQIAASQYNTIKGLIENKNGLAKVLNQVVKPPSIIITSYSISSLAIRIVSLVNFCLFSVEKFLFDWQEKTREIKSIPMKRYFNIV